MKQTTMQNESNKSREQENWKKRKQTIKQRCVVASQRGSQKASKQ